MFVLVMQFLWLWFEDLVGKGLDASVVIELLFYQSTTLIPLALPISILLSSIMTYGNLGEYYELVAIKAAGIPLRRIMLPIFVFTCLLTVLAFYIANYTMPNAFLKSQSLLYDVSQKKPAFSIQEGVFYNGIEGYSIKIGKKDPDNQTIHDIMIYDHTSPRGYTTLILAEHGKMSMGADKSSLFINLIEGKRYEELETDPTHRGLQHDVMHFKKQQIVFDLSSFKMNRTSEDLFKDNYQMLNVSELSEASDSIGLEIKRKKREVSLSLQPFYHLENNIKFINKNPNLLAQRDVLHGRTMDQHKRVTNIALNNARTVKGLISFAADDIGSISEGLWKIDIEWHRKFTLSIACLIFFFIGAPFGSIIRKGGLGMPMVAAIVIFVSYYMISISGEKAAKEGVLSPIVGAWFSSLVTILLGAFLTYKATIDSALFKTEIYYQLFNRLKSLLNKPKVKHG
jgi:lipopolysaccharide export system permease protein